MLCWAFWIELSLPNRTGAFAQSWISKLWMSAFGSRNSTCGPPNMLLPLFTRETFCLLWTLSMLTFMTIQHIYSVSVCPTLGCGALAIPLFWPPNCGTLNLLLREPLLQTLLDMSLTAQMLQGFRWIHLKFVAGTDSFFGLTRPGTGQLRPEFPNRRKFRLWFQFQSFYLRSHPTHPIFMGVLMVWCFNHVAVAFAQYNSRPLQHYILTLWSKSIQSLDRLICLSPWLGGTGILLWSHSLIPCHLKDLSDTCKPVALGRSHGHPFGAGNCWSLIARSTYTGTLND